MPDHDLTQTELDVLVAHLHAAWARLPVDHAGIWWVASAYAGPDPDAPAMQEDLGLDREGRLHWFWRKDRTFHGSAILPLTPAARTEGLCIDCAVHDWLRNTYPPNMLLA